MNLRRRFPLYLNVFLYVSRNFASLSKSFLKQPTTFQHASHCTGSSPCLVHPVHCGTTCTRAGYTSPCGCKIAERVRPRRGGYWGRIISRGVGRLHEHDIPRKMTMGMSMFHAVHCLLQVSQTREVIYVDGANRTAAAKVTPFTFQHASDLKC